MKFLTFPFLLSLTLAPIEATSSTKKPTMPQEQAIALAKDCGALKKYLNKTTLNHFLNFRYKDNKTFFHLLALHDKTGESSSYIFKSIAAGGPGVDVPLNGLDLPNKNSFIHYLIANDNLFLAIHLMLYFEQRKKLNMKHNGVKLNIQNKQKQIPGMLFKQKAQYSDLIQTALGKHGLKYSFKKKLKH